MMSLGRMCSGGQQQRRCYVKRRSNSPATTHSPTHPRAKQSASGQSGTELPGGCANAGTEEEQEWWVERNKCTATNE